VLTESCDIFLEKVNTKKYCPQEHVRIDQVLMYHGQEQVELLGIVELVVEYDEALHVEFDELAEHVETALQDFLGPCEIYSQNVLGCVFDDASID
jgi:hypothetical protein